MNWISSPSPDPAAGVWRVWVSCRGRPAPAGPGCPLHPALKSPAVGWSSPFSLTSRTDTGSPPEKTKRNGGIKWCRWKEVGVPPDETENSFYINESAALVCCIIIPLMAVNLLRVYVLLCWLNICLLAFLMQIYFVSYTTVLHISHRLPAHIFLMSLETLRQPWLNDPMMRYSSLKQDSIGSRFVFIASSESIIT